MITYTMYHSEWHVRSSHPLKGEVKVSTKSGATRTETIGKCVFYHDRVWIYPIVKETAEPDTIQNTTEA